MRTRAWPASWKWNGPGGTVANFNANYTKNYADGSTTEKRDLVAGVDQFSAFSDRNRGYSYEIGGDLDLALGPGRLKLIGQDQFSHANGRSDSTLVFADHSPSTGERYTALSDSAERIGRAEYRWAMLGGDWRLDGEYAFNRFDQVAHLYDLDTSGVLVETPFPDGSGGVTENRYETILTYSRTLRKGLTLQIGAGGEFSKLSQTGAGGLTREFTRPKGSLTLAWAPQPGFDASFKLSRTVGQLSFSDFLANVNLEQNIGNAGNVHLVPPQTWGADFELKRSVKAWGSASFKLYGRWIDDAIDIIPIGTAESTGNVPKARVLGVSGVATVNLDPLGWQGAKINANGYAESSNLKDPLTGRSRAFSGNQDFNGELSIRYDVPKTNWGMGVGYDWSHIQPNVRLFEVNRNFEGPIYSFVFIENKNVHGLTVNLNIFNVTQGRLFFDRTVYDGLRDRSPVLFSEKRRLDVSSIYRIQVKGSF